MKKIFFMLILGSMMLFASFDLNSATKEELMQIKGIGSKKADKIIEYRKDKKIISAKELQNLKGFGPALILNIQRRLDN